MDIAALSKSKGFPGGSDSKESACNAGDSGSIPGSGIFPWRRKWRPTPVFLPGEVHGQRNLVGYSPWDCKELDTIERLTLSKEKGTLGRELAVPTSHFSWGLYVGDTSAVSIASTIDK